MSDCCSNSPCKTPPPGKPHCPGCGTAGTAVQTETMLFHLKQPWRLSAPGQGYFFCDTPDCPTVYFDAHGKRFTGDDLRTPIAEKRRGTDRTLCYCFGITEQTLIDDPAVLNFIVAQTKAAHCACRTHNPSGRCCLGYLSTLGYC